MENLKFENQLERNSVNFNDQDTISKYGFTSATAVLGNTESIKDSLDTLYQNYIDTLYLNDVQKEKSIQEKNQMITAGHNDKKLLQIELNQLDVKKNSIFSQIKNLKDEILQLKANGAKEAVNPITFIFGVVILIFLTIFLFLFYSSSIYSVFFGVPEDSLGFIIPDVFGSALENGFSTFLLITLLPMIFLCLGYVMHNLFEGNEKREKEGKKKNFASLIAIVLLAFIADAIIGYKISESVHHNKFTFGETDEIWQFAMIFYDVNFYLILFLGFATYIMWGMCLHQVLSHPALKTIDELTKNKIEVLKEEIENEEVKINKINEEISTKNNSIHLINDKITKLEQEILDIRNGKITVNIAAVKGYVGAFKNGWLSFLTNYNGKEFAQQKSLMINRISDNWLQQKESELKEPINL